MDFPLLPLMAFVAIVAMIPLALWLLRRSGLAGTGQAGLLRTVASLALSPTQKVVVVELGQGSAARWLVLGVSAENLSTLATLDTPLALPAEAPGAAPDAPASTAAQLINRWRLNAGKGPHDPA